jgi:hypothetical protein
MGLAFTKSFGSICLASLIMAICEYLRDLEKKHRRGGCIGCLIACCIRCILYYLEFLTRYALCLHAMTGDSFCSSAQKFMGHLKKHGFTAVSVDALSKMVLQFGAFVLSVAMGGLTTGIYYVAMKDNVESGTVSLVFIMILLFIAGAAFAWMILSFIAAILLNVIDASYACLVLDLAEMTGVDQSVQTKQFQQPAIAQAILVNPKLTPPGYVVGTPVVVAQGQAVPANSSSSELAA